MSHRIINEYRAKVKETDGETVTVWRRNIMDKHDDCYASLEPTEKQSSSFDELPNLNNDKPLLLKQIVPTLQ